MEKGIELTSEEKIELEKRGFIVKNIVDNFTLFIKILTFVWIISTHIFLFVLMPIGSLLTNNNEPMSWIIGFFILGLIFLYLWFNQMISQYKEIKNSFIVWKLFYTKYWVIWFQKTYINQDNVWIIDFMEKRRSIIIERYLLRIFNNPILLLTYGLMLITLLIPLFIINIFYQFLYILALSVPIFIYLIFLKILSSYQKKYPIYAFWDLWEKIQSLTPRVTNQSKQIEWEFRGNMDFRVLSKSFDSLACTFSQIVWLVVKLERIEKKANKWDLFDSTKYINSLREDIRTPLLSLRSFLEKKKGELESSQNELSRVRVSAWGERGNRELQSVRSQELLRELDENIKKLDRMIEKL